MSPVSSPIGSRAWSLLFSPPVAHRGLWRTAGAPENSLAAFAAAASSGYGVELDVRLSSDEEVVVMHDAHLARMTGSASSVRALSGAEIKSLRLNSGREAVPSLKAALAVCREILVLVEIKRDAEDGDSLDRGVAEILADHDGPAAVIGFNCASHAWWRDHRPDQLRGMNLSDAAPLAPAAALGTFGAHFLLPAELLARGRDVQEARRFGAPSLVWTVRTPAAAESLRDVCDNIIFEAFNP